MVHRNENVILVLLRDRHAVVSPRSFRIRPNHGTHTELLVVPRPLLELDARTNSRIGDRHSGLIDQHSAHRPRGIQLRRDFIGHHLLRIDLRVPASPVRTKPRLLNAETESLHDTRQIHEQLPLFVRCADRSVLVLLHKLPALTLLRRHAPTPTKLHLRIRHRKPIRPDNFQTKQPWVVASRRFL